MLVDVVTTLYLRHRNGEPLSLKSLLPWVHREPAMANAALPVAGGAVAAAPAVTADTGSKLDRFAPQLPAAGQVVAPKPPKDGGRPQPPAL